jgi:hypothetical protein
LKAEFEKLKSSLEKCKNINENVISEVTDENLLDKNNSTENSYCCEKKVLRSLVDVVEPIPKKNVYVTYQHSSGYSELVNVIFNLQQILQKEASNRESETDIDISVPLSTSGNFSSSTENLRKFRQNISPPVDVLIQSTRNRLNTKEYIENQENKNVILEKDTIQKNQEFKKLFTPLIPKKNLISQNIFSPKSTLASPKKPFSSSLQSFTPLNVNHLVENKITVPQKEALIIVDNNLKENKKNNNDVNLCQSGEEEFTWDEIDDIMEKDGQEGIITFGNSNNNSSLSVDKVEDLDEKEIVENRRNINFEKEKKGIEMIGVGRRKKKGGILMKENIEKQNSVGNFCVNEMEDVTMNGKDNRKIKRKKQHSMKRNDNTIEEQNKENELDLETRIELIREEKTRKELKRKADSKEKKRRQLYSVENLLEGAFS